MVDDDNTPGDRPPGGDDEPPSSGGRPDTSSDVGRSTRRIRALSAFAPGGWGRRFAKLWGFLGFAILVVFLARSVVLPFVFAVLLAYILWPVVRRMSTRSDGSRRMPRGLAIIMCYLVLLGLIGSFTAILLPRLSKDAARIGSEAPGLLNKLNNEWAPQVAGWLERKFPSLATDAELPPPPTGVINEVPVPPGTQFIVTPLPDGRLAIQMEESGIEISPAAGGGFQVVPREKRPAPVSVEDRLRQMVRDAFAGLRAQVGGVFRFGRAVVGGVIRSVFGFFLVLMVAAFILLDIEKIIAFVRGLIPTTYSDDYDRIVAGIDRGLSGVIRGQLMICVVNGFLTYIGMAIFDVRYAITLAFVAAILSLIPIFGSILSTIPIVFAALVSTEVGVDVVKAVIILGWIIGIHFIEANFLNPKIIGTAAKIHPVLVVFALIAGEHFYGLTGALLGVPVASMVQVLFLYVRNKMWKVEANAAAAQG